MKKERQSNIELLRIISMLGVIILHYNNQELGGGFKFVEVNSLNYFLLMLLESLFICAVDLFMLISGFFSWEINRTTLYKSIQLLIQVVFFSFAGNLLLNIIHGTVSVKGLVESLVPANYFVILYLTVYFLVPYLNILYEKITTNFILVIFCLFSVYPTLVDIFNQFTGTEWVGLSSIGAFGSQGGYSVTNFIMMYYGGLFIRRNMDKIYRISKKKVIVLFVLDWMIIFGWACLSEAVWDGSNLAFIYCNPFVVLEACLLFVIFSKINMGCNKWINKLSLATFSVFLIQGYAIRYVRVDWAANQNLFVLFVHILLSSVGIYLLGVVCYVVWGGIMSYLFVKVKKDIVITEI